MAIYVEISRGRGEKPETYMLTLVSKDQVSKRRCLPPLDSDGEESSSKPESPDVKGKAPGMALSSCIGELGSLI